MAGAAVPQSGNQIGAALQLEIRQIASREGWSFERDELPAGDHGAQTQGRHEPIGRRPRRHRAARHQEGIDRVDVGVGHQAEMVVGERRVEVAAVPGHTRAHGASERCPRPAADARRHVRRDVGGVGDPERCLEAATAGIGRAIVGGVADDAVADPDERCAVSHLAGAEARWTGRRDGRDGRLMAQDQGRQGGDKANPQHSSCNPTRDPHPDSAFHPGLNVGGGRFVPCGTRSDVVLSTWEPRPRVPPLYRRGAGMPNEQT